jgi:hypothetical protein
VIWNIFNKITAEKFPNLEKEFPIQVQEASRTPNRLDKNRTSPWHIIIKTTSMENRERILKAVREKKQTTYNGKPIKIIADFSTETLKTRRAWKQAEVAILTSDKVDFKLKLLKRDKRMSLLTNKRSNTSRGKNNYQFICI